MATMTIRLPDAEHTRLKQLAARQGVSLNKLIEEWSSVALAQFTPVGRVLGSVGRHFRAQGGRGAPGTSNPGTAPCLREKRPSRYSGPHGASDRCHSVIFNKLRSELPQVRCARNALLLAHSFIRSRVSLILRPHDFGRQPMLLAFCPRVWISRLSQNQPEW